jgi:type I restriction-modification system DNA methylase subunit
MALNQQQFNRWNRRFEDSINYTIQHAKHTVWNMAQINLLLNHLNQYKLGIRAHIPLHHQQDVDIMNHIEPL